MDQPACRDDRAGARTARTPRMAAWSHLAAAEAAPTDAATGAIQGTTCQEQTRQGAKLPVRIPGLRVSIAAVVEA